jgi:hypothetical protein
MQMVEEEEAPTSLPTVTRPRLGEGNSQPSSPLRSTFTPTLPTPAHTTLSNELLRPTTAVYVSYPCRLQPATHQELREWLSYPLRLGYQPSSATLRLTP